MRGNDHFSAWQGNRHRWGIHETQGPGSKGFGNEVTLRLDSIRLNKTTTGYAFLGFTPDGFSAIRSKLQSIIVWAFALQDPTLMRKDGNQIPGLPKWAQTDRYDIAAKMSESDVAAINKLNPQQQLTQRRKMIQALLADRFKLKVHHETHEVPCYSLTTAKNGPKNLNRVADDAETNWTWPRRFDLKAHATSIADLAQIVLTGQMQCPVLDKTGVTGKYDFTLEWGDSPLLQSIQSPASANALESSAPSIFTAVQEQLGLRLQPSKVQMESIVIDYVEKPSPN
jgi:uncharacterized protein (TIGR03435 family)